LLKIAKWRNWISDLVLGGDIDLGRVITTRLAGIGVLSNIFLNIEAHPILKIINLYSEGSARKHRGEKKVY
jgi:hypothetical protein